MNVILTILTLFSAVHAVPPRYALKVELKIDGKLVASPQLNLRSGEEAMVVQEQNFLKVTATEQNAESVQVKFVVGKVLPNGQQTVLGTPMLLTMLNEKSYVGVGDGNGGKIGIMVFAENFHDLHE